MITLLIIVTAAVTGGAALIVATHRQHLALEAERAALDKRQAELQQWERRLSAGADRWITERGEWAQELEHAKAEAQQARYWMRRAHAAEDAAAKQVQEATA
jgi:hypothetical protein